MTAGDGVAIACSADGFVRLLMQEGSYLDVYAQTGTAIIDSLAVIGVDEHVWRHTRRGEKYVTVIIDLTPVRTAPARRECSTWSKAAPSRPSPPG